MHENGTNHGRYLDLARLSGVFVRHMLNVLCMGVDRHWAGTGHFTQDRLLQPLSISRY